MRVAPALAIVDRATPASMQKLISSKSGMSPSVYDARPAYHHQETSPKTVPSIKIGKYSAPPLSPIRTVQSTASSHQAESLRKAATQGEISQPLSPAPAPQPKSSSHWEASFYYKTSLVTSCQNIDVFAEHPGTAPERTKKVVNGDAEEKLSIEPVESATSSASVGEQPQSGPVTPVQQDKLRDNRLQALSPSPRGVPRDEPNVPEQIDTSFASLRLQDETSQSKWDKGVDAGDASPRGNILPLILQNSQPLPKPVSTSIAANPAEGSSQLLGGVQQLPASLSKSTSCLSPGPAANAPAQDNLQCSVNRLTSSKRASRRNSSAYIQNVFEQDKERFKQFTSRATNFHIRTCDGYSVPVHKENIMVFTNLLKDQARTRKAIEVAEPYFILRDILPYCYPTMPISETESHWPLPLQTLLAADKYGMLANRGIDPLIAAVE